VPRTATPAHIAENKRTADEAAAGANALSAEDLAALDALNEAHCYYWSPLPLLPPGSKKDM
jgi:hypothetical protein